jgi:hypothetical protein
MTVLLEDVYKKVVTLLNERKDKYIVIGGIAAGTLGEPRVTADVDVDIIISKEDIPDFLAAAQKAGFNVPKNRCLDSVERTGTFQIYYDDFHVDFIVASTDLEANACKRRKAIKLYGIRAFFPSAEDMILLKVIPGREKDLLDAKGIVLRHKGKLDTRYLKTWAKKLCDEARDMRIWNTLNGLLRE